MSELPTLSDALNKLDSWIDSNGWAGLDPYDIKGEKKIINISEKANKSKAYLYLREIIYELFYHFPEFSRKIFSVQPRINPKAMGLFASAYLTFHKATGREDLMNKSRACLDWLSNHPDPTVEGLGWGYPFDWHSKMLIPAYTPNGIVTTAVGEAFWQFYKHTGDRNYLETCVEIGKFLASLPVDRTENDKICFSYTPLFINHVHNLNLFVAEFLTKVGAETSQNNWVKVGEMAVNYTLSAQRTDGSFDYNGPPEESLNFVDNYHTGFVLRMLYSIWKLTGREEVKQALDRCYDHYIKNFFKNRKIPKLLPDRTYRIDIHSCAEAIHCISELSGTYPEYLPIAKNVLDWTLENFQDPDGHFYYAILKSRFTGRKYVSRIPYIRWSQAWMLKALTAILSCNTSINTS